MQISEENIESSMRGTADEDLWRILSGKVTSFTPSAMRIAREEGRRRGWGEGPITRATPKPFKSVVAPELEPKESVDRVERRSLRDRAMPYAALLLVLGMISGLINVSASIYTDVDADGWIPHHHETPTLIKGEWLTGETKTCGMPIISTEAFPIAAHLLCPQGAEGVGSGGFTPDEWSAYFSGTWDSISDRFHLIPVTYWGRIDRNEKKMWSSYTWRCTKREDFDHDVHLVCEAID